MSKIINLLEKTKKTQNILADIMKSLSITSSKKVNDVILHKNSSLKKRQIEILLSEIMNEINEYNRKKLTYTSISELELSTDNSKKTEILAKLGIKNKNDNDKTISNIQLPIIYYIILHFLLAIKEDYYSVINIFQNKKNDVLAKCENLISINTDNIKKPSSKNVTFRFTPIPEKNINFIYNNNLKKENKISNDNDQCSLLRGSSANQIYSLINEEKNIKKN